jgi:hypothetical protein
LGERLTTSRRKKYVSRNLESSLEWKDGIEEEEEEGKRKTIPVTGREGQ